MEEPSKKPLTITRIFDVPCETVWQAWTDPKLFEQWWGPKDFTCPFCKMDFRVGGEYLHCMRGLDNKDYWTTGTYLEIIPMEKIVATDSFADDQGNVVPSTHYDMEGFPLVLEMTITFQSVDANKTKMTLQHAGLPEGEIKEACSIGWNESFDKLAQALKA